MRQIQNGFVQQALPKRQEAVRVGNITVLAEHGRDALEQQKQRFLSRSYRVSETPHFLVCRRASSSHSIVLHTFEQADLDADLICFLEEELPRAGLKESEKEFGAALFAVLASTFPAPRHQPAIWRRFYLNTLVKLREQIGQPLVPPPDVSYIAPFAAIYRRIFDLFVGQSLLDVGCSFGFLPVLLAERVPTALLMGCDKSRDAITFSTDLADCTGVRQVVFTTQDLLDVTIRCLGTFETVTAIHVLEHISEGDLFVALTHLLQLASKRLIIAVPYEQQATPSYGHEQVFTQEKLEWWGQWCVENLQGAGRYWCEDVAGGMLIVDRLPEEK